MTNEVHDVLIIGSGHSGGMAAKILTEAGIRCVMLNAGPVADISRDAERLPASKLPYRGFRPPGRLEHVFQSNEFNANVWVDEQLTVSNVGVEGAHYCIESLKNHNFLI